MSSSESNNSERRDIANRAYLDQTAQEFIFFLNSIPPQMFLLIMNRLDKERLEAIFNSAQVILEMKDKDD